MRSSHARRCGLLPAISCCLCHSDPLGPVSVAGRVAAALLSASVAVFACVEDEEEDA